jgi:hypothetical protein
MSASVLDGFQDRLPAAVLDIRVIEKKTEETNA